MNRKEFEYFMKRGLGRCILELKRNDNIEKFRDIVLKGCLNNYSYDTQCEGTRSEYMYVLQSYYDDEEYFEDKIIKKFCGRTSNEWLFDHLANLLYIFADEGSKKSYRAMIYKYNYMYVRLRKNTGKDTWKQFEWLCIWLVTLKGFDWFKKIVLDLADYYERQAKRQAEPVSYSFDWFWSACKEHCDEKEMVKFVVNSSRKGIRIFWDSLSDFVHEREGQTEKWQSDKKKKPEVPTAEQLIEECMMENDTVKYRRRILRLRFANCATDKQVRELAEIIIHLQDNKDLQAKLLEVFRNRMFPLDAEYLMGYAEDENMVLSKRSLEALSIVKDVRVKEYANMLIQEKRNLPYALVMIFSNYTKEDDGIILKLLKQQKISYKNGLWHWVFQRTLDWLEKNQDAPDAAVYYLYENTLCSWCRESVVELMINRGLITEDIRRECKYDSNSDIRDIV
ncbi:MAG: hypothetical protein K2I03_02930 [Lachnospiraceae bacterium]|nr:hypothetical protein [Lachnospiraceae bacterium]